MKINLKRMGLQSLAVCITLGLWWGAGTVQPLIMEETKEALTTSIDINWIMEKTNQVKAWGTELGGRLFD